MLARRLRSEPDPGQPLVTVEQSTDPADHMSDRERKAEPRPHRNRPWAALAPQQALQKRKRLRNKPPRLTVRSDRICAASTEFVRVRCDPFRQFWHGSHVPYPVLPSISGAHGPASNHASGFHALLLTEQNPKPES